MPHSKVNRGAVCGGRLHHLCHYPGHVQFVLPFDITSRLLLSILSFDITSRLLLSCTPVTLLLLIPVAIALLKVLGHSVLSVALFPSTSHKVRYSLSR